MYLCTRNYDLKRGGTFETAKAGTFHSVTAGTSIPLFTFHFLIPIFLNHHINDTLCLNTSDIVEEQRIIV